MRLICINFTFVTYGYRRSGEGQFASHYRPVYFEFPTAIDACLCGEVKDSQNLYLRVASFNQRIMN